jgi:site-specific recombinase XerD
VKRIKGGDSGDHRLRGIEIRALRRLRREGPNAGDFAFVSERGGPLTNRAVQLMLDRVAERAGLQQLNIHPHALRHSCGYYLSEHGADLRLIQAYLGHRQVRHTTRYVQLVRVDLRDFGTTEIRCGRNTRHERIATKVCGFRRCFQ